MRNVFFFFLFSFIAFNLKAVETTKLKSANISGYDTTRLYKALAKAKRGEPVTLAYIGGSITYGSLATSDSKRYINLVTDWWKTTFPDNKNITMVNAGIGGTGSDIGVFRVQKDVLSKKPDVVVIEFSVNDSEGLWAQTTMEGMVRQILSDSCQTAIVMLMLKQTNGTTAQKSHKLIGNHYQIPMVSFADLVDAQVAKDNVSLTSLYSTDGLHPVDLGMKYIAQFVTDELQKVYNTLPADSLIPDTFSKLPAPLVGSTYDKTYKYDYSSLVPVKNTGWVKEGSSWSSSNPGDEIAFEVDGNSISIMFSRYYTNGYGQAEVWIDDKASKTYNAHFNEKWGPASVFGMVDGNLPDGKHILHIKVSEKTDSGGHYFKLMNVFKAGNIRSAAPIALTNGDFQKAVKNTLVEATAAGSYDPDSSTITSYNWKIVSKPDGSTLTLSGIDNDTIKFTPDIAGIYKIGLTVSDGQDTSVLKILTLTIRDKNNLPVANAGADTTLALKKYIVLNASASSDEDNDSLTYKWRIIGSPNGSKPSLQYTNKKITSIKVDITGEYIIGLTVNDGISDSYEDTITLIITEKVKISQIENNKFSVDVFPNPTRGSFNIVISSILKEETNVSIISPDGKIVYSGIFNNEMQTINLYNISDSKAGLYILHAQQGDVLLSKKLILNR